MRSMLRHIDLYRIKCMLPASFDIVHVYYIIIICCCIGMKPAAADFDCVYFSESIDCSRISSL